MTWQDILAANERGVVVKSRQVALDPPPDSEVPMSALSNGYSTEVETTAAVLTVASMAVLEIVLLAGPAFAVGARRSRRQLGLVAPAAAAGDRSGPWCSRAVRYSAGPGRWPELA